MPVFKRRKLTHPKRARVDEDNSSSTTVVQMPDSAAVDIEVSVPAAPAAVSPSNEPGDAVPTLKEILRQRKRPNQRFRDAARKPEGARAAAPVHVEAPKADLYAGRFVAQTGQVVDRDDKQM